MLAWRVYYDDGSTFDSSMGGPDDAPPFGVVCVLQRTADGCGVVSLQERDFFVHDGVAWVPVDKTGIWDRLINRLPLHGLLIGRMLRDDVYVGIIQRKNRDMDFYGSYTAEQIAEFNRERYGN